MARIVVNPIFADFLLECTGPGCKAKRKITEGQSGMKVGDVLSADFGPVNIYGCPRCKRPGMKVIEGPPPPKPKDPKGFTKIPTE